MDDNLQKLIAECKELIEQTEPFQRKMKAKHSRMKKRVIGYGGQSNSAPFTKKPSMKRSKSAPPIGEIKDIVREELILYLLEEGLFDKLSKGARKVGLTAALGATIGAGTGTIAKGVSDLEAQERAQMQQNIEEYKPNTQFDEIRKQYDIFMVHVPSSEQDYKIIKNKLINFYDINDQDAEKVMKLLSFKPWDRNGIGNARTLIDLSALYKMENPNISKNELFREVIKSMTHESPKGDEKPPKNPDDVAKKLGVSIAFGKNIYL